MWKNVTQGGGEGLKILKFVRRNLWTAPNEHTIKEKNKVFVYQKYYKWQFDYAIEYYNLNIKMVKQ